MLGVVQIGRLFIWKMELVASRPKKISPHLLTEIPRKKRGSFLVQVVFLRYRDFRVDVRGEVGESGLCYYAYAVVSGGQAGRNYCVHNVRAAAVVCAYAGQAGLVFKEHSLRAVRNVEGKVSSVQA